MSISGKMMLVLTVITMLSGGILSTWDIYTKPKIEHHHLIALQNALKEVLPEYDRYDKISTDEISLYIAYLKEQNEPVGVAFETTGNGFQGVIDIMIAVTPDFDKIIGMKILEQLETPGLGTKIVNDPSNKKDPVWFTKQFRNKLTNPPLIITKSPVIQSTNEIQAITGATISSRSVVNIINNSMISARYIYNNRFKE